MAARIPKPSQATAEPSKVLVQHILIVDGNLPSLDLREKAARGRLNEGWTGTRQRVLVDFSTATMTRLESPSKVQLSFDPGPTFSSAATASGIVVRTDSLPGAALVTDDVNLRVIQTMVPSLDVPDKVAQSSCSSQAKRLKQVDLLVGIQGGIQMVEYDGSRPFFDTTAAEGASAINREVNGTPDPVDGASFCVAKWSHFPPKVREGVVQLKNSGHYLHEQRRGRFLVFDQGGVPRAVITEGEGLLRCQKCKHQRSALNRPCLHIVFALLHLGLVEIAPDKPVPVKGDSPRDWAAMKKASEAEAAELPAIMAELAACSPPRVAHRLGAPAVGTPDLLIGAMAWVWRDCSMSRVRGELATPLFKPHVQRPFSAPLLSAFMSHPQTREVLDRLLLTCAAPGKMFSTRGGPDGTGFQTSRFYDYCDTRIGAKAAAGAPEATPGKSGQKRRRRRHVMAIPFVLYESNLITAAAVISTESEEFLSHKARHDASLAAENQWLIPLVERTKVAIPGLSVVSGDPAYLAKENFDYAQRRGIDLHVRRKSNSNPATTRNGRYGRANKAYSRKLKQYQEHPEEHLALYHSVRNTEESCHNSVKQVLGGYVRSRDPVAQENEIRLKYIVHNLRCLLFERHRRGLVWDFREEAMLIDRKPWTSMNETRALVRSPGGLDRLQRIWQSTAASHGAVPVSAAD